MQLRTGTPSGTHRQSSGRARAPGRAVLLVRECNLRRCACKGGRGKASKGNIGAAAGEQPNTFRVAVTSMAAEAGQGGGESSPGNHFPLPHLQAPPNVPREQSSRPSRPPLHDADSTGDIPSSHSRKSGLAQSWRAACRPVRAARGGITGLRTRGYLSLPTRRSEAAREKSGKVEWCSRIQGKTNAAMAGLVEVWWAANG